MLKIVICDDEKQCCEELRQAINHTMFEREEVLFEIYTDGKELIELLGKGKEIDADLIFLDIFMPGLDGLKTARILRKNHIDAEIVFVTAHSEMALHGYKVRAFDFLIKPITDKKVEELFLRYYEENLEQKGAYFLINKRSHKEWISLKNVRYFLSDKRKIRALMRMPQENAEFYMKMDEVEDKLQKHGFIRCHQSYLVNIGQITGWDENYIMLQGNEKIPISRRYKVGVKETLKSEVIQ